MDTGGVVLSIYGVVNEVKGRLDGVLQQIQSVEDRQTGLESRCVAHREAQGKDIDTINHRLDQWSGMAKGLSFILFILSTVSICLGIWNIFAT